MQDPPRRAYAESFREQTGDRHECARTMNCPRNTRMTLNKRGSRHECARIHTNKIGVHWCLIGGLSMRTNNGLPLNTRMMLKQSDSENVIELNFPAGPSFA